MAATSPSTGERFELRERSRLLLALQSVATGVLPLTYLPERDIRPRRIRYSAAGVLLLGGVLGSGLNLAAALLLYYGAGMHAAAAIFVGTLLNESFHYVYYHAVFINQEIRNRLRPPAHVLLYLTVATGASALLSALHFGLGAGFAVAAAASIAFLSFINLVAVRISTFSSANLAEIAYRELEGTFYDDQTDPAKVNWFRAWFHSSRFERLNAFVAEHHAPGKTIADLGCGNCSWNTDKLDVTGVDVNEAMMRWGLEAGHLSDYVVSGDLSATGLPDKSFDIVVMSETLEHLLDLTAVVREVRRILRDDGVFLITVPNDYFLGPFFVLFNANCLYQGYVRGSIYHKYRCGHINHFSRRTLDELLRANGFGVERMSVVNQLTVYAAARKLPDH
jgi:SAM-dependent methyltransferase